MSLRAPNPRTKNPSALTRPGLPVYSAAKVALGRKTTNEGSPDGVLAADNLSPTGVRPATSAGELPAIGEVVVSPQAVARVADVSDSICKDDTSPLIIMRVAEGTASGSSEASTPRILTSKSSTGSSSGRSTASDHDITRSIEVHYVPEMTELISHSEAELKGLVKSLTAELRHHKGLLKQTQAQNEQFKKLLKDVRSNEDLKRNEFRAQMRCQQETVTDSHLNVLKTTKDVREFAAVQFTRTEEMANRVEELTKMVCALRDSIPQQVHTGIKDIKHSLSLL
jgi:hypothetical protein